MRRIERFLTILTIAVLLLVLENFVTILELHHVNQNLRAVQRTVQTIQDDVLHVKEDVEANGDALDYISSLLDDQAEQQR
ncbi:MAG: hypothetical protein IT168_15320 [Bryobacterales bacterium]|nr:hypothetical protein [Bryobacterales bacterium]